MSDMAEHAKPPARRDHLWVLFIVAACCLIEVWTSWVTIGAMSGFPKLFGKIGTDWTLAVTTEAYWAYALFAWLGAAPGPKSRRFAMWSAAAVFAMSLTGQGAAHLVKPGQQPSGALVVFVSALPVIVLASIAILIHFRQADREDARRAQTEREADDERAALRKQVAALTAERDEIASALRAEMDETVSALRAELDQAVSDRESAQREMAEALRRAEKLDARLAAAAVRKPRKASASRASQGARDSADSGDVSTELAALMELRADPELRKPRKGGELARRIGVAGATARRYREKYLNPDGSLRETFAEPAGQSLSERSE